MHQSILVSWQLFIVWNNDLSDIMAVEMITSYILLYAFVQIYTGPSGGFRSQLCWQAAQDNTGNHSTWPTLHSTGSPTYNKHWGN